MKFNYKVKFIAILLCITMFLAACGNNNLILTKDYDFFSKLNEVEAAIEPVTKQLTEDMFLSQTDMNELSGKVYEMWEEFLDEVIVVLEENLSKKEYKAFEEEQAEWKIATEEEVKAYVAEFGDGSIAPLIFNMKMSEKIKFRVYDLAKYFERSVE